jgi:hypothetical protein
VRLASVVIVIAAVACTPSAGQSAASAPRSATVTGVRAIRDTSCLDPQDIRHVTLRINKGDRQSGGNKLVVNGRTYWATWCGLVPLQDAVAIYS